MRCLNLAEAWRRTVSGPVSIAGEISLDFVRERAEDLGVPIVENENWPEGEILVVDSYNEAVRADGSIGGRYGRRVLVDDLGEQVPDGYDTVWNPNPYGDEALYPRFAGVLITGRGTVPIRPGLPKWEGSESRRVGVALGGGQVCAETVAVLADLARRTAELAFAGVGQWVPPDWTRLSSGDPWADLARCNRVILAAGGTTWEAAFVGVPVVLVVTADNQELVADWASAHGAPIVDFRRVADDPLAHLLALEAALDSARPLPRLESGSENVARLLSQGMRLGWSNS